MKNEQAHKRPPANHDVRLPSLFSLQLRRARQAARWEGRRVTMQQVADTIGVNMSTYWRWENGKAFPEEIHIGAISEIFDMEGDEIWINTFRIPPDMHRFLTTTQEGAVVLRNIRGIMNKLEEQQKPTTRRGLPDNEQILKSAASLGRGNKQPMAIIKSQAGE